MSLRKHNKTSILLIGELTETIKAIFPEKRSNFSLEHVSSFDEGMILLREENIDLVLMQLDLPDISGFKTLKKYLNRNGHTPVIVLTDTENETINNQAIKAGAQDVLNIKQLNKKTLQRAINFSLQRFQFQSTILQQNQILTKRERSYNLSQKIATFGNWELNIIDNKMVWSDGIFSILEVSKDQVTPSLSVFLAHVFNEEREKVETFFEQCTKDNELHKLEFRVLVNNAKIKQVALSSMLYFDEATENFHLLGGLLDITDEKTTKQYKNATAIERYKKQVIEDFYFQIRTPLSSINNLLFLTEHTNLSTEQKEYLSGFRKSINELSGVIYNMLNYSELSFDAVRVKEEAFDLKQLMDSVKFLAQFRAINSKTNIVINSEKITTKITADNIKLTQVLYNLIGIAVACAYPTDIIIVTVNIDESQDGNRLHVHIENNGREWTKKEDTISNEDESKNEVSLSITKKLLKAMGGILNIPTTKVFGTDFSFSIPVKITDTDEQRAPAGLPDFEIKILLVEDHFLNQIATRKVLTVWSPHITVDIAKNGIEGVAKFKTGDYDLILMDLQMPVMNGINATRLIRKSSNVPIIALTAESSEKEKEKCAAAGMNDYITKPFKPQELYSAIQKVLSVVRV